MKKSRLLVLAYATVLVSVLSIYSESDAASPPTVIVDVRANQLFNSTDVFASPGTVFQIHATGTADLSIRNGAYVTNPDGVIVDVSAPDTGAFQFFRDFAEPLGVDPEVGDKKLYVPLGGLQPGHLPLAPYGALVAGFSQNPIPSSFSDFPDGFQLISSEGTATAPQSGGFLFLAVNDIRWIGTTEVLDNAGSYFAQVVVADIQVSIDIKPGNKRNVINPRARGSIWVAILSDVDPYAPFDPSSQVDITTVEFGPDGAKAKRHKVKDINKDGLGDLLLRFKLPQTGIACEDTEATLIGETFDGQSFTGTDAIKTVGCKPKKCHNKKHHKKHHHEHNDKGYHNKHHDDDHKKR